jgi:hypothetical protein
MSGWLGLARFGQAKKRRLCFVQCIFGHFLPLGGLTSHSQIATSGPNLISPPHLIIQTYNNQPSGGWALAELARGMERLLRFVAEKK